MRSSLAFFRIFPPPTFMLMPHVGLDISDDAIRAVSYSGFGTDRRLSLYGSADLPPGLIEGGDIKDEKEFVSRLSSFSKEHGLSYVKVSVPEEKAYLFQTDVPVGEQRDIAQNIESKLEENVPLSAQDAVFYFDLLPVQAPGATLRASVAVVPNTYIEHAMSLLGSAGLTPIAFEIVPKSIARAVVSPEAKNAKLIIHVMGRKTGIYVVSSGVVSFASTTNYGLEGRDSGLQAEAASVVAKEISRVYSYWMSHGTGRTIDEIVLVGRSAPAFEGACRKIDTEAPLAVRIADVWSNAFDINRHLPSISKNDSLEYAVAAGLAFETSWDAQMTA